MMLAPSIVELAGLATGRDSSLFAKDMEEHRATLTERLNGVRILVIGGAGTLGSEFIRAVMRFSPSCLIVVDSNENALAELVRECRSTHGLQIPDTFLTYAIDFSEPIFDKVLDHHGPFEVVANFAAHKHVRSEKDVIALEAMFNTNLFKAQALIERLCEQPPTRFFSVSTDKAAAPASLMGASKRVHEDLIMAYASRMKVSTARFANVAFSNGSLLQGILQRLSRSQPLSVPNNVRRTFVSPVESGEICLLACVMGNSGEKFFPKLDDVLHSRSLLSLTNQILEKHGLQGVACASESEAKSMASRRGRSDLWYPVFGFTSDTSGEKLSEIFHTSLESVDLSRFRSLGVIPASYDSNLTSIQSLLANLRQEFASKSASKARIIDQLTSYLKEFKHIETGRNLDQVM